MRIARAIHQARHAVVSSTVAKQGVRHLQTAARADSQKAAELFQREGHQFAKDLGSAVGTCAGLGLVFGGATNILLIVDNKPNYAKFARKCIQGGFTGAGIGVFAVAAPRVTLAAFAALGISYGIEKSQEKK
jgi:hypothetical protein